jgi:hypothetical protein
MTDDSAGVRILGVDTSAAWQMDAILDRTREELTR